MIRTHPLEGSEAMPEKSKPFRPSVPAGRRVRLADDLLRVLGALPASGDAETRGRLMRFAETLRGLRP